MASPTSPSSPTQIDFSPESAYLLDKLQNMPRKLDSIMAVHTKAILQVLGEAQGYNRQRMAKMALQLQKQEEEITNLKALVASLLPKPPTS